MGCGVSTAIWGSELPHIKCYRRRVDKGSLTHNSMLPNIGFQEGGIIMSPKSKREYLEAVHRRYKTATRHEKTAILNEFCANYGCHRKHAIRVLRGFKRFTKPKPNKRGKPPVYQNATIIKPFKEIWLTANLPYFRDEKRLGDTSCARVFPQISEN